MKVALAVPALPSVTVTSSTESDGSGSSSVIVPRPWPSAIVAFEAPERPTVKVSSISSSASPIRATSTVFEVWPGVKVSSAGRRGVVAGRDRRAVDGRVVDGHRLAAGRAQADREGRVRVPRPSSWVTSLIERAGAASSSVIVPTPCAVRERRVRGARQVEEEALVRLVEHVAVDEHGDRLRGLARPGSRASRSPPRSRPARPQSSFARGVRDRDVLAADRAEADGEGRIGRARIALGDGDVADRQRRRRRRRR